MLNTLELRELIENNNWQDIPSSIITREGKVIDTSNNEWNLPNPLRDYSTLNFEKIKNKKLRWAVMAYVCNRLETVSTIAGQLMFEDVWRFFLKYEDKYNIGINTDIKEPLIEIVSSSITNMRSEHKLWALYRPIQWYIWCADHFPELGFCPNFSFELEGMSIPSNPKGEAVRMEDSDTGPLHRTLELPLIIHALKNDHGTSLNHLQQKAAVALSIAFGRNPDNLTFLREEDLKDLTPHLDNRCYVLSIPRIKKRQVHPRDDLIDEFIETTYANYLIELIKKNQEVKTSISTYSKYIKKTNPLFLNTKVNKSAVKSKDWENVFNMTSSDISKLLYDFVRRHNIISPLTNKLLKINTRRFRYTLATNLATEGISKQELARILDHTDTQHVEVYFELAGKIIEHLDKAISKGFNSYLNLFKGNVIENKKQAINGKRDDKNLFFIDENNPIKQTDIGVCGQSNICHLDPPFSCYLCPKFQPYRNADHQHVLDCLSKDREKRLEKYETSRIGIQLDEVIAAVTQVTNLCKKDD